MKYGTGHVRELEGHTLTPLARLSMWSTLTSADLEAYSTPVLDQGPTSSCEGHGNSGAVYVALAAAGYRLPWIPSQDGIYKVGRCIDRVPVNGKLPALSDDGARSSQVVRGMQEYGIRPMSMQRTSDGRFSDVEVATVNKEPPLNELIADARTVLVGAYGITSKGKQRSDEVATCLSNGIPVVLAVPGGAAAFQSYTGGVLSALHEPIDHCVFVIGFYTLPDGSRAFIIRNSWGEGWGHGGHCVVDESFLDEAADLFAMKVRLV